MVPALCPSAVVAASCGGASETDRFALFFFFSSFVFSCVFFVYAMCCYTCGATQSPVAHAATVEVGAVAHHGWRGNSFAVHAPRAI